MGELPRYPIYIPTKGRFNNAYTIKALMEDKVPFYIVVEPPEKDEYGKRFGYKNLLVLPWSGDDDIRKKYTKDRNIENGGLIAVRNWIKEHSIKNGDKRHWQLDDNMRGAVRWYKNKRINCNFGTALRVTEDFVDRYENVAIAGLNYEMFGIRIKKPFILNVHVYSCSLILNQIPHKWRLRYNDDTDICIQVLNDGWCTVLINSFMVRKIQTMLIKGGNTDDLYQGSGRLIMARNLERNWPKIVKTIYRFKRPQHCVNWGVFKQPLIRRKDIDWDNMKPNNYGLQLVKIKEIKSKKIKEIFENS